MEYFEELVHSYIFGSSPVFIISNDWFQACEKIPASAVVDIGENFAAGVSQATDQMRTQGDMEQNTRSDRCVLLPNVVCQNCLRAVSNVLVMLGT